MTTCSWVFLQCR